MTGPELKAIREKLGLSLTEWGRVLGYQGSNDTVRALMHKYENGSRTIPPMLAILAKIIGHIGLDKVRKALATSPSQ